MFIPNEHVAELNDLLTGVTQELAHLGVRVTRHDHEPSEDRSADLHLTLEAGDHGRVTYPTVVTLGRLDRPRATSLALPADRPLLLLAPHVPDAVAEVLRARGVDHADAAGNVRLDWDGFLVDVRGRRPTTPSPAASPDRTAARAFTRAGTAVVFSLLSWPDVAARPVRQIAETSATAVGTVHTVLRDLTAAGYLREAADGRALNRAGELLDRWAEAYTVTLARPLALGSFSVPDPDRLPQLEDDLFEAGAQLGGERAATRIDAHLHASTATYYVEQLPTALIARYRLRPDAEGSIRFRRRFWHRSADTPALVPSPLVYADLVSSGDPRQREHAERIRAVDHRLVELDRT